MNNLAAFERIFRRLPKEFTRKQVLHETKLLHYSYATADATLQKIMFYEMAERIGRGKYRKLNDTNN